MTTATTPRVAPADVHSVLKNHILADGHALVMSLERSHGARLYDSLRERELLDFFTCYATVPLGYNHPKLDDPDFVARLVPAAKNKPSNSDLYTTQMAEFVETFSRTVPESLSHRIFFIEGGALAVENALKTAFDWKVRKNLAAGKGEKGRQIIHFRQAFHGRTGYTLSLTNTADPRKTQYFPKFDWPRVTNPKIIFPLSGENLEAVQAAERQALREIRQALDENPDDIAGLIIEPIQGEGGDNHFRVEFLRELRRLADEEAFLLIFDEVQTGFGATGRWWCLESFDVLPDVVSFGKKTQVCGIFAGPRVDEVDSVFKVSSRINSTWGGNLVDMIRCQRFVEIIEEDDLLALSRAVGERLLRGFQALAESFPETVGNPRGRGTFLAFDLPDPASRDRTLGALLEQGLIALKSGPHAIRFRPPLTLTHEEADEGLRLIRRAVESLA